MKQHYFALATAFVVAACAPAAQVAIAHDDPLTATIAELDREVFDGFNRCDEAGQLERHEKFFDEHIEFYHDTGGVTWTRDEMIANTAKNVCGKFTRRLVEGSLRVYPVKDFGAIEMGTHEFCQEGSKNCDGKADFTIVWRNVDGVWKITRVLSYGHRAG